MGMNDNFISEITFIINLILHNKFQKDNIKQLRQMYY